MAASTNHTYPIQQHMPKGDITRMISWFLKSSCTASITFHRENATTKGTLPLSILIFSWPFSTRRLLLLHKQFSFHFQDKLKNKSENACLKVQRHWRHSGLTQPVPDECGTLTAMPHLLAMWLSHRILASKGRCFGDLGYQLPISICKLRSIYNLVGGRSQTGTTSH